MNIGTLGNVLLGFAAVSAVASIVALAFGGKDWTGARRLGNYLTFGVFGFTTFAILLLASAFLNENFALEYVAYNHPTIQSGLTWAYQLSGVWAGREGSLLFWEWILAIYAAFIAFKLLKRDNQLGGVGLAVVNFVQLFFLAALFIPQNNPFQLMDPSYLDPNTGALLITTGMNPLLQTWAMVLHPPTLFIGYAGLTVPFAFALAALITGDTSKQWVVLSDRITVFSWLLLGIGIGLGSVWAYYELAFGGYWAWDPVENASLLPWLTGVGLLHSMTVYRRRDSFKAWAFVMAAFTFVFVLLGTFITRSGVVQSVHAFQEDPWSFWLFMIMMSVSFWAMIVGVVVRGKQVSSEGDGFENVVSKEGSYYFNNVIMLISAVLVAYLTLAPSLEQLVPLIGKYLPLSGQTIKPPAFDALARPLGIFYIFVMTICPILAWGGGDWKKLWERAKMPVIIGTVLAAVFLAFYVLFMLPYFTAEANTATWWHHFLAIAGVITAGYAIALPLWLFFDGARKRAAATGTSFASALGWLFTKARTQSGGYLTHLGMGIILLGLVGSTMFVQTYNATLPQQPGAVYEAGEYSFTFVSLEQTEENIPEGYAEGDTTFTLTMDVTQDGQSVGRLQPQMVAPLTLKQRDGRTQHVSIMHEAFKDVFVSFSGTDQAGSAVLTIKYFPMQSWVWFGFFVTIVGSAIAAFPKKRAA